MLWITKYRYQVLKGDIAHSLRELVRQTCLMFEIEIIRRVVSKDHVHILVSAPPTISPADLTDPLILNAFLTKFRDFYAI